jgi:glycosyltransferase involved in cell wall biosynthesis
MPPPRLPLVTVIVPCRNAERHIGRCLKGILRSDYPSGRLEVLVVDGMSDDRTREIVGVYTAHHPRIRLLDNARGGIAAALNLGIRASTGAVLVWMDAHVSYPPFYVSRLVEALDKYGADAVGGTLHTLPTGDGPVARAIATAMSHPVGGGSPYHGGPGSPRWVSTIPFFCIRREMFDLVGGFDEELGGSHGEEFNARLIQRGGRLLLLPDVVSSCRAPATLRRTGWRFYRDGYFKPLVAKKSGRGASGRQLVPPLFVLALACAAGLAPFWAPAGAALGVVAGSYAAVILGTAIAAALRHGPRVGLAMSAVFPVIHVSYAVGFWRRLLELSLPAGHDGAPLAPGASLSR